MDYIAVNIALEVSLIMNNIAGNKIKFDFFRRPHITLMQFFTSLSNINKIGKLLEEIEIPKFNCNYTFEKKGQLYFILVNSSELDEFQKMIKIKFQQFIDYPSKYKECFCEEIKYVSLPELVLNHSFHPHITIGISDENVEVNYSNIIIKKLDLYKVGDFGTTLPINKSFFFCHRINTSSELDLIDKNFGVELDLRDKGENLIICHDPFKDGEIFRDYLEKFDKKAMILNIKSERIEYKVLEEIKNKNFEYFFLDCSFPMINQLNKIGEKNIAIRFSEFEPIENVVKSKELVNWVWIDCFTRFPLDVDTYKKIKKLGLKICLVSPELQGHSLEMIDKIKRMMFENNWQIDAICCKYYNVYKWM